LGREENAWWREPVIARSPYRTHHCALFTVDRLCDPNHVEQISTHNFINAKEMFVFIFSRIGVSQITFLDSAPSAPDQTGGPLGF
jgi:hypothetical protein